MTFEERYGEEPDFLHAVLDMSNLVEHMRWKYPVNATHVRGALWAIEWIANHEDHQTYTGIRKLWDNMLEQEPRLLPLIKHPPTK